LDPDQRKIFCLVEAPDADTAHAVHREAHGLVADEIYVPAADQVIDSLDVDDLGTAWFGGRLAHRRRVTAQP